MLAQSAFDLFTVDKSMRCHVLKPQGHIPSASVDIIMYFADRNESRKITPSMVSCCEFLSGPKLLMSKWLSYLLSGTLEEHD